MAADGSARLDGVQAEQANLKVAPARAESLKAQIQRTTITRRC